MTDVSFFALDMFMNSDEEWLLKGRIGSVNPVKGIKKLGYGHRFYEFSPSAGAIDETRHAILKQ